MFKLLVSQEKEMENKRAKTKQKKKGSWLASARYEIITAKLYFVFSKRRGKEVQVLKNAF